MFGYVTICESELKVKDWQKYKAYYCGLCRMLKKKYGNAGQLTLTYDMTFAVIFLTSLYEYENVESKHRCKVHPVKGRQMLQNECTEYAADMNILLSYYHLKDDWEDEKKFSGLAGKTFLKRYAERIAKKYPRQSQVIQRELKRLADCEKLETASIDDPAGCFGRLMAEILVYKQDIWEEKLRRFGFFMGKYIYIMDAYDDLEQDRQSGSYNPLKSICQSEDYEEKCRGMLCMMLGESSAVFESLPCLQDADILRNILYMGVWNRYNKKHKAKNEKAVKSGKH